MSIRVSVLYVFLVSLITSAYAQLSQVDQFRFIENKGQWHSHAQFISPIPDGSIILSENEIYYHFIDGNKQKEVLEESHHGNLEDQTIPTHTFKMSFEGSQKPTFNPTEALIEKRNFLRGNDPSKWAQNITAYQTVTYTGIYPGIDFTITEKNRTVKYEFVVAPGSKPKTIQLAYKGVNAISILNEQLVIQTSLGNVIDDKPFAYQMIGDKRKKISCEYVLKDNILSYKLGKYDKNTPLVIDPKLIFSTSSGSFADNWGNTACFDRRGNLYTGGTLFRTSNGDFGTPLPNGFPTTIGAAQNTFQGGDTDMAIMKFDSSGTFLQYSTIIGGSDAEIPTSTVVNENDELYILGTTASPDFPVTPGAFDTQFEGSNGTLTWFVNGVEVGTGTTYTGPINDGDEIYARLNSGYSCENEKQQQSNSIFMQTPASPQVSITASSEAFCPGDAVSFTANTTNSTSPTYEWFLNGNPTGINSPNFTLTPANDNDSIRVVVTDASCSPTNSSDTSDYIILTSALAGSPTATITPDHFPVCTGEEYTFNAVTTLGGDAGSFAWRINGLFFSNDSSITASGFINTDQITLDFTPSLTCLATTTVTSNTITVDNSSGPITPTANLIIRPYSDCDINVKLEVEGENLGSSPFYQWVINNSFQLLSGTRRDTFELAKKYIETLPMEAWVTSSSGCAVPNFVISNKVFANNVDALSSDFKITASTDSICGITPITFTADVDQIESQNYSPVGGYAFDRGTDIVVIHLSADGTTILDATYVGGIGNDGILETFSVLTNNYGDQLRGDVNLDSLGNVYVASVSASADFPTVNAAQPTFGGGQTDAVIFKMDPTLSTMLFSTYLGGAQSDGAYSIQTNDAREVYVAGGTNSTDFPIAGSPLYPSRLGDVDGFVSRFSNNGSTLLSSTLLGTPQFDQSYFVQLDTLSNAYVLGQTLGDYPHLKSKYRNPNSGLFLQKLSPDLSTSIYSTVLGDEDSTDEIRPNISPTAFLVNECENIFISGWGGEVNNSFTYTIRLGTITYQFPVYNGGYTFNMPLTSNAFQSTTDGSDFYLMALLKDADSLIYSTYFGGNQTEEHVDGGTSRFDFKGIVYQSVCANCGGNTDFPTFPDDGSQATYPKRNESNNCNNGVFKFDLATLEADFEYDEFCEPNTITFANLTDGGIDFLWDFGDGNSDFTLLPDTVWHTYDDPGTYIVTLIATDLTTCVGRDTVTKEVFVPEFFTANSQIDTLCEGSIQNLALLDFDPEFGYKWNPSSQLNNDSIYNPDFTADSSIQYLITVTDTNGCTKVDTFTIVVLPEVIADFEPIDNCAFQKIQLANTSQNATSYEWKIGNIETFSTDKKDTITRILPTGIYVITLQAFNDSTCNKSDFADTQTLAVLDSVAAAGDTTMCKWETANPRVIVGNNPVWEAIPSLSCTNCTNPKATPLVSTNYVVSITQDTCVDRDTVKVEIIPYDLPLVVIDVDPPRCFTDTVLFEGFIESNDCECCEGIKSYLWTFDDGTTSTEANPKKLYTSEGTYTTSLEIIARDTVFTSTSISLLASDSCIKNIYIPNAFTPNNDNENDILFVRAVGIVQLDFHLFNRWGEEVFTTTSRLHGWNGTYKGAIMSPQVFTYTCHATYYDGEEFHQEGNVTLLE